MDLGDLVKYYQNTQSSEEKTSSDNAHPFKNSSGPSSHYPKYVPYDQKNAPKYNVNKKKPKPPPRPIKQNSKNSLNLRCDSCDIYFKDQKLYDSHIATHIPCEYEGCSFSTTPVLMRIHNLLHVNNMLTKLETPEEIEKYREERRKRFPTKASIEAKKVLQPDDNNKGAGSKVEKTSKKKKRLCKYFKMGNCKKGEDCLFSHQMKRPKNEDEEENDDDLPVHVKRKLRRPQPVDPNTLLSNIVQVAQKKERRAILQCIAYIVSNNFFNPNSEKK